MADWDSKQYMKFSSERTQPSKDLIHRLGDISPERVLDLGCGPGNSTSELKKRFCNAHILGVDSSDDMLFKARHDHPDLSFKKCFLPNGLCDIDGEFDLIFSNACIHWIKEQKELIDSVYEKLSVGGVFAVQIPYIQKAPFYRLLGSLVANEWRCLADIRNFYNLTAEEYYDILSKRYRNITVWETAYYHIVPSYDSVIEWYSGSGLRPYLQRLADNDKPRFLSQLRQKINENYPLMSDNNVILKMPRLFFIAKR